MQDLHRGPPRRCQQVKLHSSHYLSIKIIIHIATVIVESCVIFDMWNDLKTLQPAPTSLSFFESSFFATSSLEITISTLGPFWDYGLKTPAAPSQQRAVIITHHPTQGLPSAFRLSSQPTNEPTFQPTNDLAVDHPSVRPTNFSFAAKLHSL